MKPQRVSTMMCSWSEMSFSFERALLVFLLGRIEARFVGLDSKEAHQVVDCVIVLKEFFTKEPGGAAVL